MGQGKEEGRCNRREHLSRPNETQTVEGQLRNLSLRFSISFFLFLFIVLGFLSFKLVFVRDERGGKEREGNKG